MADIADLREKGFPVKVEMKTNPHTGQRYASYSMDDSVQHIQDLIPGAVYRVFDVKGHPFHPALLDNSDGYFFCKNAGTRMATIKMAGEEQVFSQVWLKGEDFKVKYIGGMN
mgnify:CR=1 FL=1